LRYPRILIIIPTWKRPEITEICFQGLSRIRKHRDKVDVLVCGDNESLCKKYGITYTFFENQPLGAKKNHLLKEALKHDWDYLMELNSDNVIKNDLLDIYDELQDDYIALRNFCFMDSLTFEVRQIESKTKFGIARRYSRKAIEACKVQKVYIKKSCISAFGTMNNGIEYDVKPYIASDLEKSGYADIISDVEIKLWDDKASIGMDNHSNYRLNENGFFANHLFTDEPLAVDIKSDVNIWKFNPNMGVKYNLEELLKGLPEVYGFITNKQAVI